MSIFSPKKSAEATAPSVEKQLLESMAASTGDAVIFYDTDFTVRFFNHNAEKLFGLNASQIIGVQFSLEQARRSSSKLLAHVMFPSLAPAFIRQSPEGEYPQIIDLVLNDPDFDLRVFLNKVINELGQPLGFIKIVHDQTLEKEVLRSHQEFITVAAHQLRTPATAVNWVFENLLKDAEAGKNIRDMVNVGQLAAKNLMKIIDDLLNISQIEGGRFGYSWQEIDLVSFLERVLADAEAVAREYKVRIYLEPPPPSLKVSADVVKLGIAFSNLIDNAIKYNVANGEVRVRFEEIMERDHPAVRVSVQDTGIGIPPEGMKKLFGRFFRVPNMSKAAVEGSGLGLYITKNVIERHGGHIWVESVVNRGSTFFFTLPLLPSKTES